MPSKKERKRKNPVHLKRIIRNAQKEIEILEIKLSSQEASDFQVRNVENRICTLMNRTIPNAQNGLKEKIFLL